MIAAWGRTIQETGKLSLSLRWFPEFCLEQVGEWWCYLERRGRLREEKILGDGRVWSKNSVLDMSSLRYLWITCQVGHNMWDLQTYFCLFLLFFMCQVPVGLLDTCQAVWHTGRQASPLHPHFPVMFQQLHELGNTFINLFPPTIIHWAFFWLWTSILLGTESGKIHNTKYQDLRKSHLIGEICWQVIEIYVFWVMCNLKNKLILSPPFLLERDPPPPKKKRMNLIKFLMSPHEW